MTEVSTDLRIAIRQPEYFPRLEYFALMQSVDLFVVADTFQYSRQSFQNRSAIRTPHGRHWISIPLLGGQHGRAIGDVLVANKEARWQRKHWRTLEFNYRSTPYFEFFEAELSAVLASRSDNLKEYTLASLLCIRHLLGLRTKVVSASELPEKPSTVAEILGCLGARQMSVLPDAAGTAWECLEDVLVLSPRFDPYRQNFPGFEADLSALDALLNLGPASTRKMIQVDGRLP